MRNSGKAIWIHSLAILLTATLAYSQNDSAGATAKLLTCESQPGGKEYCGADASSGVALATQMSSESCLLGKTWGEICLRARACGGVSISAEGISIDSTSPEKPREHISFSETDF